MSVESATPELTERLPGLDSVERTVPDPQPGHWIERGPLKRLMVFCGRSHPELAQRIAEQLGVELGEVELETFANDETYCRYLESIRGNDVFIVQNGSRPSSHGSRTRARIARRSRASPSPAASWRTCSSSRARTGS